MPSSRLGSGTRTRWRRALNPVSRVDLIALNESTQVTDVLADAAPAWYGPAMRQALRPTHKRLGRLKRCTRTQKGCTRDKGEVDIFGRACDQHRQTVRPGMCCHLLRLVTELTSGMRAPASYAQLGLGSEIPFNQTPWANGGYPGGVIYRVRRIDNGLRRARC